MEKIHGYSSNMNVQMLIALMKAHGIKRVIVSPGGTHNEIVVGLQYNGEFELYSTVDERGAAYMAVGMAEKCGEPVAVICTESVASRNYYPAITEAYYRKLPVLAITGLHGYEKIGHLYSQVIDRSVSPKDTFKLKVHLPEIKDDTDIWESNILINNALLELKRHGGGPVHIDLPRSGEKDPVEYSVGTLCDSRIIRRYCAGDDMPDIPEGKTAIFIGTHSEFTDIQANLIDKFCASFDAVAFCGHTSGYKGKYKVSANLVASQKNEYEIFKDIDLLIHIGEPAADEATMAKLKKVKNVWRVNPDGEIRDTFKRLSAVFEMDEETFFRYYCKNNYEKDAYLKKCLEVKENISVPIDKLPFSNIYTAAKLSDKLPENTSLFIGGSSTIRAWSMFDLPRSVSTMANMGTRGIDGVLSSFIGASFVNRQQICYCVLGDLTFFYDMNAIGNRDIGNNIRILLINDGGGGLFKLRCNEQYSTIGIKDTDPYIAARGHFGNKSSILVKSYAESLGFEYMTASDKESFESVYKRFITPEMTDHPILFEIFTNENDERDAFDLMYNIDVSLQGAAKQAVKRIIGQKGVNAIKKVINSNGRKD